MKHKKIGVLHLMGGKHGRRGKRKIAIEFAFKDTLESYMFGFHIFLIFFFFGLAIEFDKKKDKKNERTE